MEKESDKILGFAPEELQREADEIRAMIDNDPELEGVHVTEEMHLGLMEKIRKYEEEKAQENLSEEDREALRLGRELQNRTCQKRKFKNGKAWAAVAATFVLVAGVSVTSVGEKDRLVEMFGKTLGSGEKTYVDSGDEVISGENMNEEQAYAELKEELGIDAVRLIYKPEGTEFLDINISKKWQEAVLMYSMGDNILNYQVVTKYVNGSTGIVLEDELLQEYQIELPETNITVQKYKVKATGEIEYKACFGYENSKYFLYGVVEQDEFEKILKNLHFF